MSQCYKVHQLMYGMKEKLSDRPTEFRLFDRELLSNLLLDEGKAMRSVHKFPVIKLCSLKWDLSGDDDSCL